jgi:prepilin-type N-terminal cleavage/methylation domain-containing protein/prepilin-type processing-associated H-X9-DG protein
MRHAGFTLVEIIVVVSILAFLMALLAPVLSISREQARTTLCAARMDDIALSLHNYDTEYGTLPYGFDGPAIGEPPGGSILLAGWYWFHFTGLLHSRSIKDRRLLQCPSKRLEDSYLQGLVVCGNYGVNRFLCKSGGGMGYYGEDIQGTPLSTAAVRQPGETLLIVDSGFALVSWWNATKQPPRPIAPKNLPDVSYIPGLEINSQISLWPGQKNDAIGGRHRGKIINVAFVDGHISQTKASELLVEKTGEDEWNYSPLWRFK